VLVLGIDIGGTSTRALVTTVAGERVAFGSAGAGNPVTVPAPVADASLRAALAGALSHVDPRRIGAVVAGAAGASHPAPVEKALRDAGITCSVSVVGDAVTAFAAGTDETAGTVLIAGTGAVAARVEGGDLVRTADGLGWLLGDLGSAFWIGREAAVVTADQRYDDAPESSLTRAVATALGVSAQDGDAVVTAVYRRAPRDLAALAPLVTAAAPDPRARAILEGAASHLHATLSRVLGDGPLVLAGGVLRHSAPVREALLRRLGPHVRVSLAGPGEVGAARLAAQTSGHVRTSYPTR
jgi:N-acetylglucosamine kinase-like BadF-type ATPase